MWLLTAVGPVNGQHHFTFVLEKNRQYTVGREKSSDISFQAKTVRPKEGVIEVGDWSPTEPNIPPKLVWRPEPKKNGSYNPLKSLTPNGEHGSIQKEDYGSHLHEAQAELPLDESGMGVELNVDSWFTIRWQHLSITYDKMKNEEEEFTANLRNCCISWTASFQQNEPPDVVISGAYKVSQECYFAVCYGVPIASEQWLAILGNRLRACWKKVADAQDSFELPDPLDDRFRPPLDSALKGPTQSTSFWIPRPENRTLFQGWRVLLLRGTKAFPDKRYYIAMGATWEELDVLNPTISTAADFVERVSEIRDASAAAGEELVMVFLPSLKKDLADRGVNFESVFVTAAATARLYLAAGNLQWRSVGVGVQAFLEKMTQDHSSAAATAAPTSPIFQPDARPTISTSSAAPIVAAAAPAGRLTRRATSRASSRAPSAPPSTAAQPDAVPSTFPDDSIAPPQMAAPPVPPAKKPLKRRAHRAARTDDFDDIDMAESSQLPSSLVQPSHVPDTQISSGSQPNGIPDSMELDPPTTSAPSSLAPRAAGRLKRRAGVGPTQSSFLDGLDVTVAYQDKAKEVDRKTKQRELYDELHSMSIQPAAKRTRTREPEPSPDRPMDEIMEVDEEDFVSKALRTARTAKTEAASPIKPRRSSPTKAAEPVPQAREPSAEEEEEEELQGTKKSKKGKAATQKSGGELDKDNTFLQAIAKSNRSKKAMDELDTEFNQLRIPKPNTKGKTPAVTTKVWEARDYSILNDMDTDLRGNFIAIVKKDLFRKDKPKVAEPIVNGGPNFKKFKKKNIVRRDPVPLVLAAQHAQAEMGEPYWQMDTQAQRKATQGRTQVSQTQRRTQRAGNTMSLADDDDDDVPLVPRGAQQRLLAQIEEDEDEEFTLMPPTSRRRGATPLTQSQQPRAARDSRAGSAMSEASSAGASAAAAPATRTQRARRATQAKRIIEDSDDEGAIFATAPTGSGRGSRLRGTAAAGPSAKTSTLAEETVSRATRGTQARSTQAAPSTSRRKLLVDDDDDDIEFTGVQKKRRLR